LNRNTVVRVGPYVAILKVDVAPLKIAFDPVKQRFESFFCNRLVVFPPDLFFAGVFGGVEVYVVRSGVFATATIGTLSATNSGKRLFGIKEMAATYAAPKGIQYDEKKVTLKTGREISVWANIGAKVWTQKANLLVAVTLV